MSGLIPFIQGGIGDMLQALSDSLATKKVAIQSHYSGAANIFLPFDIQVIDLNKEKLSFESMKPCDRSRYLEIPTPIDSQKRAMKALEGIQKPIVGIQMIGSKFHNQFWYKQGGPLKLMPLWFLEKIVSDDRFHYLLFGTDEEIDEYESILSENVTPVTCEHIWDSLAYVDFCDKIVAVDSAIKAYAVMRRKKSLVFVGDCEDHFRDNNFINPYVLDGYMKVSYYKEFTEANLKDVQEYLNG